MEMFNPGTTVYFCWYDFQHKKEHTLTGEVVDNSDYQDTQWADFVYVRFQPTGVSAPIYHHFLPERLSTDQSNVPHDDCYLMLQSSVPSAEVAPQPKPKQAQPQKQEPQPTQPMKKREVVQLDLFD